MSPLIGFREFELDANAYELKRNSKPVKLERLAMDLLLLLIENRHRVVSRDEIVEKLWGKDVFLDAENGINTAIRKIRRVLKDDPVKPRFVRTVPARGYQFIAEAAIRGAQREARTSTIAVLPFDNFNDDPSQEYFADGITEETIATLGALGPRGLAVIARTSSMVYKRSKKSIKQIARELGAEYVLESSVRREGGRVRITSQLIRASDQIHVWASSYERQFTDLISVQQEIAQAIAEQVRMKLPATPGEHPQPRTSSVVAYDHYLRGRYFFAQRTPTTTLKAIECYRKAIEADGEFGLAYAGLADAHCTMPITGDVPTDKAMAVTLPAANCAVELDPHSAEAWTAVAGCRFWLEWKWDEAIAAARRAVELNPSYALAHFFLAHTWSNLGEHDESLKEINEAIRLDPFSVHLHATFGQMRYQARRFDEAIREARVALSLNANSWLACHILGKNLLEVGQYDEALEVLQKAMELAGNTSEPLSLKAIALCRLGRKAEAREILATMKKIRSQRYLPSTNVAMVHLGLEETEEAVHCLEEAARERDVRLIFVAVDIKWDALNADPRVRRLWPQKSMKICIAAG